VNPVPRQIHTAVRHPLVAICLVLVACLGVTNYFLWRQRLVITRQHDEIRGKGEAILDALIDREHVNSDLARLREALAVIDRNLVVEADMEMNLGYFYKLEKFCHIRMSQLSQLSSPPLPENTSYKIIPVSLRATGTYLQLMNFLRQLETGPRIVTVRAFSFSRADPKVDLLALDLTVDMLGSQ
jgi:Tfp pilus assembly protein PilO